VSRLIARDTEVPRIPAAADHVGRVSANKERFPCHKQMVVVEGKRVRVSRNGAEINRHLAVVFAAVLEWQFEGPHGGGIEMRITNLLLDLVVRDREVGNGDESRVLTSLRREQPTEILQVQRAGQAFADESQLFKH